MGSFKKLVNILLGTKKEYAVKDEGTEKGILLRFNPNL